MQKLIYRYLYFSLYSISVSKVMCEMCTCIVNFYSILALFLPMLNKDGWNVWAMPSQSAHPGVRERERENILRYKELMVCVCVWVMNEWDAFDKWVFERYIALLILDHATHTHTHTHTMISWSPDGWMDERLASQPCALLVCSVFILSMCCLTNFIMACSVLVYTRTHVCRCVQIECTRSAHVHLWMLTHPYVHIRTNTHTHTHTHMHAPN